MLGPAVQHVRSRRNALVARFRSAAHARRPDRSTLLLDGVRLVRDACAAGAPLVEAIVAHAAVAADDRGVRELARALEAGGVPVAVGSDSVMAAVSPVRAASAAVALGRRRPVALEDVLRAAGGAAAAGEDRDAAGAAGDAEASGAGGAAAGAGSGGAAEGGADGSARTAGGGQAGAAGARRAAAAGGTVLGAVGVQDPGNLGALVRTAEAAGAAGLAVAGAGADPFGWKALRGAMGSTFRLPVADGGDPEYLVEAARAAGFRVLAAAPRGGRPPDAADLGGGRLLLLVGGEGAGAERLAELADEAVSVPMAPAVESLNVAVAAGVLLYEARRQRARSRAST